MPLTLMHQRLQGLYMLAQHLVCWMAGALNKISCRLCVAFGCGRWQLHIPEFYELDFESKIFAKVAEKSDSSPVDDLLDSRSFIL